ncbi:MAG: FAD-dependent oxidoreductase [Gammaproteobacteria bacterium]|nr:FAD-dependent oxidoreductase [Gammaproteobacteria bacterium]
MLGDKPHCTVVGAGIVGITIGIDLLQRGFSVTLIDPNGPASMTSSGNAGGFGVTEVMPVAGPGMVWRIPSWLMDPRGPLAIRWKHLPAIYPWLAHFLKVSKREEVNRIAGVMSGFLAECMTDSRKLFVDAGLAHLLTEKGALTVYRSRAAFVKDRLEWEVKQKHGIRLEYLNQQQINEMEPALVNANHGWFTPDWCNTIDPYRLGVGLFSWYQRLGGKSVKDEVVRFSTEGSYPDGVIMKSGASLASDRIVIAAGAWSKSLCHQLGERVLLESERGYNATLPDPNVYLDKQVIFGEEKFVISNIGNGIRIGGAAEFAGLDAPPNYRRSERLVEIAKTYLPKLNSQGSQNWMGHRPSTPDSMPVISPSEKYPHVYYAFGHGHLGLTMAATTAKLLGQMMVAKKPAFNPLPFHINRFSR